MKYAIALIVACFVCQPALSQDRRQASCMGILDRINYNYLKKSSMAQQYALNKANFCSAEYDKASEAQKANIEASYELFSASGGMTSDKIREKQKSECNSQYGEFWYNQADASEQRIAVVEALETVNKCIELSISEKLDIETTISQDNGQVDINLKWNEGVPLVVKYAGPQPWNAVPCYINGVEVGSADQLSTTIAPVTEWSFSCRRNVEKKDINGEPVECVSPFNIVINTDKVSTSIPIPRACETDYLLSKAKQVDEAVTTLRNELNKARSDLDVLSAAHDVTLRLAREASASIGAERSAVQQIIANSAVGCPAGFTDKGKIGVLMAIDSYQNNLGEGGIFGGEWRWTHPKLCQRN